MKLTTCLMRTALALMLGLGWVQSSTANVVIDDFNTTQQLQGGPAPGAFNLGPNTVNAAGIIGGSRSMSLQGEVFPGSTVISTVFGGVADLATSGFNSVGTSTLLYNNNGAGLGNLLAGTQQITATLLGYNAANNNVSSAIRVTVTDASNNSNTQSITLTTSTNVATPLSFNFVGSGVDFNNLTSVVVTLDNGTTLASGATGADITIADLIAVTAATPVPEPMSLAIWTVLGGVGLVVSKRYGLIQA